MAEKEKKPEFVITDRRLFSTDGELRQDVADDEERRAEREREKSAAQRGAGMTPRRKKSWIPLLVTAVLTTLTIAYCYHVFNPTKTPQQIQAQADWNECARKVGNLGLGIQAGSYEVGRCYLQTESGRKNINPNTGEPYKYTTGPTGEPEVDQ